MGYPSVLTAKTWGFYDVLSRASAFKFQRPYGSYVMENVLFKISLPGRVPRADRGRVRDDSCIRRSQDRHRRTSRRSPSDARGGDPHHRQEGPARQSGRPRPLHPVHGRGAADLRPAHRRGLRGQRRRRSRASTRCATRSICVEDTQFTQRLPRPRASARSPTRITVEFNDGTQARRRSSSSTRSATAPARKEGIPVLVEKFRTNLARRFPAKQQQAILDVCARLRRARAMPVHEFVDLMVSHEGVVHAAMPRCRPARPPLAAPALAQDFPKLKPGLWDDASARPTERPPAGSHDHVPRRIGAAGDVRHGRRRDEGHVQQARHQAVGQAGQATSSATWASARCSRSRR